jgi:hypothetical protein
MEDAVKTLKEIVVFAFVALIVGACGRQKPPEIQIDTLEVLPPADAPEIARLAALCQERARVDRMAASVEAMFRVDDANAMSYAKGNQWMAARDAERKLARELVEVFVTPREARLSVGACVWYDEKKEEYSFSLVDGLLLADEVDYLLRVSGGALEDIGVTAEEFRRTVLNDVRLTLAESWNEPYLFEWVAYRACRRGFSPLELGLEKRDFNGCRYTGGTG